MNRDTKTVDKKHWLMIFIDKAAVFAGRLSARRRRRTFQGEGARSRLQAVARPGVGVDIDGIWKRKPN